jgi:hypothetical protein
MRCNLLDTCNKRKIFLSFKSLVLSCFENYLLLGLSWNFSVRDWMSALYLLIFDQKIQKNNKKTPTDCTKSHYRPMLKIQPNPDSNIYWDLATNEGIATQNCIWPSYVLKRSISDVENHDMIWCNLDKPYWEYWTL